MFIISDRMYKNNEKSQNIFVCNTKIFRHDLGKMRRSWMQKAAPETGAAEKCGKVQGSSRTGVGTTLLRYGQKVRVRVMVEVLPQPQSWQVMMSIPVCCS